MHINGLLWAVKRPCEEYQIQFRKPFCFWVLPFLSKGSSESSLEAGVIIYMSWLWALIGNTNQCPHPRHINTKSVSQDLASRMSTAFQTLLAIRVLTPIPPRPIPPHGPHPRAHAFPISPCTNISSRDFGNCQIRLAVLIKLPQHTPATPCKGEGMVSSNDRRVVNATFVWGGVGA